MSSYCKFAPPHFWLYTHEGLASEPAKLLGLQASSLSPFMYFIHNSCPGSLPKFQCNQERNLRNSRSFAQLIKLHAAFLCAKACLLSLLVTGFLSFMPTLLSPAHQVFRRKENSKISKPKHLCKNTFQPDANMGEIVRFSISTRRSFGSWDYQANGSVSV